MTEPKADLYERFRAGDEGALRMLVERHVDILLQRLSGEIPAALQRRVALSDVVQEACIAAYYSRGVFEDRGPGAFRQWLTGIARNKLKEAIRHHGGTAKRAVDRVATRSSRPDTNYLRGPHPSPSVVASTAERVARVRDAMARLPEDYRTVLHLALEKGLALREVAEHMGRSREATKKLYGRALCRLREDLGESAS